MIATCSGCRGDGRVSLYDRSIFDCPKCGGDGMVETLIPGEEWEVKTPPWQHENPPNKYAHKVVFMQTNTGYHTDSAENRTRVRYDHFRGGGIFDEDVCFPTLEEAVAEIDKRNNL